jgi:tRNA(fMet)-specific endonuclease VapC
MIRFVLDTDILFLLQHGHSTVVSRVSQYPPGEVAISIITVEEQLTAWYTLLRRAKRTIDLVPVYERMTQTVCFLRRLPILTFSNVASETYDRLRKQKPRTGRIDLRIAAVALANNATLVTRNRGDFEGLAGLTIEDWSCA